MKNLLRHVSTASDVQFEKSPSRGEAEPIEIPQASAYDSDGAFRCHTKATIKIRTIPLVFDGVLGANLATLIAFIRSRKGDRDLFSYYDQDSALHPVRFDSGRLAYRETSPGKFRVAFQLSEEL
jgi:hypothetical protein